MTLSPFHSSPRPRSTTLTEALRHISVALSLLADEIDEKSSVASTGSSATSSPAISKLVSVAEAAELLGISEKGVRRLILRGELAHRKLGARVLIPSSAVDAYRTLPAEGSR
jgi:excisionase family DNA binding protein